MEKHPSLRGLTMILTFVIAAALGLWLVIFFIVGDGTKTARVEILMELSKVLLQLVFVTLIGATISFFYGDYSKKKEAYKLKLQEDNKLRRDLLDSLIGVRAQVEKTRREFRLLVPEARKTGYHDAIRSLLEARLNLSQVWHDTETFQMLYSPKARVKIQSGLDTMKVFLDSIVDEYEVHADALEHARGESGTQIIANLPVFSVFVKDKGGPQYVENFLGDYRSAAGLIRAHLVQPDYAWSESDQPDPGPHSKSPRQPTGERK